MLNTAKEVFATEGRAGSLLDIAARAGVGAGTVHRHFPSKEALYAAVIAERLTGLLDLVPTLPDEPIGDRLFSFLCVAIDQVAANVALCEAVTAPGAELEVDPVVRARFATTVSDLVHHAHDADRLIDGITAADVAALLAAAATAETREHDAPRGQLAELIIASLRKRA